MRRSKVFQLQATLLLTSCAMVSILPAEQVRTNNAYWDVRYQSGSVHYGPGMWLRVSFNTKPQTNSSEDTKQLPSRTPEAIVELTSPQLVAVFFNPKAEKSSQVMQLMSRSGCGYAKALMPKEGQSTESQQFIGSPTTRGAFARAMERLNHRNSVRLLWMDSGARNDVTLMVNDCEYASFIASLRRFAGARWQEVARPLAP